MKIGFISKILLDIDVHIFLFYKGENFINKLKKLGIELPNIDRLRLDFTGEYEDIISFYSNKSRIYLVGLGDRDSLTQIMLRNMINNVMYHIKKIKCNKILLHPVDNLLTQIETILLYTYSFKKYKTNKKNNKGKKSRWNDNRNIKHLYILKKDVGDIKNIDYIIESVNMVKDLGNEPGNILNPIYFSDLIYKHAKKLGVSVEVLTEKKLKKLNMNTLLSVASGSKYPARMVVLKHMKGTGKPIVLVGKGITFDTGGISIKHSHKMYEMKTDMLGAATVFGIMNAVVKLKLKINLVCLIPIAENMVGRNANRPGDIVKSMSGITIEIRNTDAEGRLVMADAITYGVKMKPKMIIDISTLTGQQEKVSCGLFSTVIGNDRNLISKLIKSGDRTDERVVEFPLYPEYLEYTKSNIADIKNAEFSCSASTILGGAFLSNFVGDIPWLHLDIAGTGFLAHNRSYLSKGVTGVGVRLFIDFLKMLN